MGAGGRCHGYAHASVERDSGQSGAPPPSRVTRESYTRMRVTRAHTRKVISHNDNYALGIVHTYQSLSLIILGCMSYLRHVFTHLDEGTRVLGQHVRHTHA